MCACRPISIICSAGTKSAMLVIDILNIFEHGEMALESENKGIKTGRREISPLADVAGAPLAGAHDRDLLCPLCDASIHS